MNIKYQNSNLPFSHPLLLIDGVCNLCNASVRFLIRHDSKKNFRYGSLQSEAGKKIIHNLNLTVPDVPDTMILIDGSKVYVKSGAWLEIFRRLGGCWKVVLIFKIFPVKIRDGFYDWVARNRYRWFGKKDVCDLPTPELRDLFIE